MFTYSEFLSRESGVKNLIKASTAEGELLLALNCVGGKETGEMGKLLGPNGFLGKSPLRTSLETPLTVLPCSDLRRYGQSATRTTSVSLHLQEPHRVSTSLSLPRSTHSLLLSAGFWLSNWIKNHPTERGPMMNEIAQLVADGKLKEPETEIVELSGDDESVGSIARGVMRANAEGRGKKVLFKFV